MDFTQSLSNSEEETIEDTSFKERFFHLCYFLNRDIKINFEITAVLYILETVQLISYAFSYPLQSIWKIPKDTDKIVHRIVTSTRISCLFELFDFNSYLIIWIILLIIIFLVFLSFVLALQINTMQSLFYRFNISLAKSVFNPMSQFFMIPILETLLIMNRCENNHVYLDDGIECFKGIHILYCALSIIFGLVFIFFILVVELFNYTPFRKDNDKIICKINNSSENFLCFMKVLIVLCYIIKMNEWIFTIILIFTFTINLISCYEHSTFNNDCLELIISIRNCSTLWSYIVIILGKISGSDKYID